MKKTTVWGWLIILVLMAGCAYGSQCKKAWHRSQKYGANAYLNYNVQSAHCMTGD